MILVMSGVQIPLGVTPNGEIIPIEEAERYKPWYYQCPECGGFLSARKGQKNVHHFAHAKGELDEQDCPLGSAADVQRLTDRYRVSNAERLEDANKMRVTLRPTRDGEIELEGLVPSFEWTDFREGDDVRSILEASSVKAEGVIHTPSAQRFHPSEAEVSMTLDPEIDDWSVEFVPPADSNLAVQRWNREGMEYGHVFVGDHTRAEQRAEVNSLREGQWVYVFSEHNTNLKDALIQRWKLGPYEVVGFQFNEQTQNIAEALVGEVSRETYGFDADIVLPGPVSPTTEEPIVGAAGDSILLGIEPGGNLDPTLEVVQVPRDETAEVEIPKTGPGNPRFREIPFPENASQRVSIHQPNTKRHRLVQVQGRSDIEREEAPTEQLGEIGEFGVRVSPDASANRVLHPLRGPQECEVSLEESGAHHPTKLEVVGPEGMRIDVHAKFVDGAVLGPVQWSTFDDPLEATEELNQWIEWGCERLELTFGSLGSARVTFLRGDG